MGYPCIQKPHMVIIIMCLPILTTRACIKYGTVPLGHYVFLGAVGPIS